MNLARLKISISSIAFIAFIMFNISFRAFANIGTDSLVKLGMMQVSLKQYSPAKATFLKSIKHYRQLGDKESLIAVMNNIGMLEEEIKQPDSAMRYYRLGLSHAFEIGDSMAAVNVMINTANLLMKLDRYAEAKSLLNTSIRLSNKVGYHNDLMKGRGLMAELLYKQGNFKDAYRYQLQTLRFSDSISLLRNKILTDSLRKTFEKDLPNVNINSNKKSGDISQFFSRGTICFLLILGILIGMLVILFYTRNKGKEKLAILLEETRHHNESREAELRLSNSTKDKFFSIIAQDLRNPFTAILGFADILKEEYGTLDEKEKMLYIRAIHSSSFNIYELLKNLHDWSRSQAGTIEVKPSAIDLSEMAEQHVQLFASYAQNKDIQLSLDTQGQPIAFADRNMVSAIIRNLLNNAIKFTNKGGEVHVNIQSADSKVELSVTDIGVGISEENLKNLFNLNEAVRSKGTADESGTGLGLILCKKFVTMNQGTIRAESVPGKGSRFTITLPLNAPEKSQ
jgi:signal transduction histidine kinase